MKEEDPSKCISVSVILILQKYFDGIIRKIVELIDLSAVQIKYLSKRIFG